MENRSGEPPAQLYLLRLWTRVGADGTVGWRGKLQPLLSDSAYCFATAPELLTLLGALLTGPARPVEPLPPTNESPDDPRSD